MSGYRDTSEGISFSRITMKQNYTDYKLALELEYIMVNALKLLAAGRHDSPTIHMWLLEDLIDLLTEEDIQALIQKWQNNETSE